MFQQSTCIRSLDYPTTALIKHPEQFLETLVSHGGPTPDLYAATVVAIETIAVSELGTRRVREILRPILTTDTMQGFGFLKPHGYSGDFEMIDRIYTKWITQDPTKARWDHFFHAQPAPRAVRNRVDYLCQHVSMLERTLKNEEIQILNLGAGPARDVMNCLSSTSRVTFDCIDADEKAVSYASSLCADFEPRVSFLKKNVIRMAVRKKYHLVWSAGLFDYFPDNVFLLCLRRLFLALREDGELVIGNFGTSNPSRIWMETVGDWHVQHRSKEQLENLAAAAGVPVGGIRINQEPEGVNLFLHITNTKSTL